MELVETIWHSMHLEPAHVRSRPSQSVPATPRQATTTVGGERWAVGGARQGDRAAERARASRKARVGIAHVRLDDCAAWTRDCGRLVGVCGERVLIVPKYCQPLYHERTHTPGTGGQVCGQSIRRPPPHPTPPIYTPHLHAVRDGAEGLRRLPDAGVAAGGDEADEGVCVELEALGDHGLRQARRLAHLVRRGGEGMGVGMGADWQ